MIEHGAPVGAPGRALLTRRGAEHLFPAIVPKDVKRLGVIQMNVLIVPHTNSTVANGNGGLAELEPLLDQVILVFASAKKTGDGRGGQGGLFAADGRADTAAAQAVDDAAALRRRVLQIIVALLD